MKRVAIFGATSAVAESVARLFARDGAQLHLVGRSADSLLQLRGVFASEGASDVSVAVADLADLANLPGTVATAVAALGHIDVALIAHGVLSSPVALRDDPAALGQLFDVNATSPAVLIEQLLTQASGTTIVVLGSLAGDRARPANYAYAASKAALEVFVDGARYRAADTGTAIVLIKLGFVRSPMTAGKPVPPFASTPDQVASVIHRLAVQGRSATAYVPGVWRLVMFVVRLMPRVIVRRMRS